MTKNPVRVFWFALLALSVALLACCCATSPEQAAGIGAASVAAFDAALNSLIATKTIDPGNALALSNGVHQATDSVTGLAVNFKALLDTFNSFKEHSIEALSALKQSTSEQIAAANEGATIKMGVATAAGGGLATSATHILRGPARKTP